MKREREREEEGREKKQRRERERDRAGQLVILKYEAVGLCGLSDMSLFCFFLLLELLMKEKLQGF